MAILVETRYPHLLVQEIKEKINNGGIDTWSYDKEGDFTHAPDQWIYHAWIRPIYEEKRVIFAILGRSDKNLSTIDYAVYHGRFVEMLLTHFDSTCIKIEVTPLASQYDKITVNSNN